MAGNKYAVIGIGQFGKAIAKAISAKGYEVMAIDSDPEIIDSIGDDVAYAVALDATDKRALQGQSIEEFDAVVVAIGSDFEQLVVLERVQAHDVPGGVVGVISPVSRTQSETTTVIDA